MFKKYGYIIPYILILLGVGIIGFFFRGQEEAYQAVENNEQVVLANTDQHTMIQQRNEKKKDEEKEENEAHCSEMQEARDDRQRFLHYDPEAVNNISPEDLQRYSEEIAESPEVQKALQANILGQLVIPNTHLNVSVLDGLSEYNLISGAGTFYSNQVMGENNYALASHNVNNNDLLLGPLIDEVNVGDLAYLTDYKNVYVYQVSSNELVDPSQIEYVNYYAEKPLLTLVTCGSYFDVSKRQIAQAELVDVRPYDGAIQKLFVK